MRIQLLRLVLILAAVIHSTAAARAQDLIFADGFESGTPCSTWSAVVSAEVCDGVDNDCDGEIDEDVLGTFFRDFDTDTYGDPAVSVEACVPPAGYVSDSNDCNDLDATVNPGFAELCDAKDNDCNTVIDDKDADSDLHIDSACTAYPGALPIDDCNDSSALVNPGQAETCGDGLDNDCDGSADNKDADSDLRIDDACGGTDCDDSDGSVYPGAIEACDGKDTDCNAEIDDKDLDQDGHVDELCGSYSGPLPVDDCDDTNIGINPDMTEVCGNPVDEDCSSAIDDRDADGDGSVSDDPLCGGTDCDDDHPHVYPGAPEYLDGKDNDCDADGGADEGLIGWDAAVVTEILYDSSETPDESFEWFELFNPTQRPVNLRSWVLRDTPGPDQELTQISADLVIEPRGFAVLCNNGSPAYNGGVTCDYEYGHLTFGNSADELFLEFQGTIVDIVTFGSGWPSATSGSLNLDPDAFFLDNNTPAFWCNHPEGREIPNGDEATPGVANVQCGGSIEDPRIVAIYPTDGPDAGGTQIRIVGSGFTDATDITVGGVTCPAFQIVSDTEGSCTTPPGTPGTADLVVWEGGTSRTLTGAFTFTAEATTAPHLVDAATLEGPASLTVTRGLWSRQIFATVTETGVTGVACPASGEFPPGELAAEVGYGPFESDPRTNGSWIWLPAFCFEQAGPANRFTGTLNVPDPGTYSYCYRFTVDGGLTFNYADLDGGAFDPLDTATLTVQ